MSQNKTIQQTETNESVSSPSNSKLTWKDYSVNLSGELLTNPAPKASNETYSNWVYAIAKAKVSHVLTQLEAIPEPVLQLPSLPAVIQGMLIAPFIDQLDCTAEELKTWFTSEATAQKVELNPEASPNSSARTINRWLRTVHGEIIDGFGERNNPGETLELFRDYAMNRLFESLQKDFAVWSEIADGVESKGTREPLPKELEDAITKAVEDWFIALGPIDKEKSIPESKATMRLCQELQRRRTEELPKLKNTEPRPGGNPEKSEPA